MARNGIAASGPKPWSGGGGGQVYELAQCPFSEAHSDGAWAAVMGSGALAAGCQHMSCAGWGWAELRAKYEGPRRAAVGGRQPEPNRHNRQPLNEVDVLEVCAARTAAMARVREAIDAAKEARDAAPVWAAVGDLAELDQAAYGSIKSELVAWKTGAKVALSPRDLDRAVRDHRRWRANERRAALAAVPGQLPRIYVNGRALRDISAEAITHLALGDQPPTVFLRSGVLARTRTDEKGRVSIDAANESFLRGRLDRTAEYLLRGDDADKPVPPPIDVVRDVMALDLDAELARLGLTPLPRLVGVIESPGPRPDGSLILAPGYDPATGLYYAPGPGLGDVRVPDAPTLADVAAARDLIDEVLWDFPFDVQASRANAFAAVLTIVVRPMICGPVPLAIIDKPQPGTGGSLLVEVIALFGTGQPAAMSGAPTTEDEWRKAITTHVRDGVPLIVWDNVEVTLESDSLARFLTARVWADRLLSTNTSIRYEVRAVQLATGNNVALGRQLTRRVYRVRLNAKVARPEQRVGFRHPDLLRWVGENRGRIVAAVLVLCRAWVVAGRPPGDAPMLGSFEDWSAVVGGILTFAGIEGFGRDRASAEESPDDESAEWDAFFTAVGRRFGRDAWTAGQLVKEIGESPEVRDALPIALSSYVRQVPGQFGTTWLAHPRLPLLLGKAISQKNETRYASGVYVRKAGKEGHAKVALWRVQNDNPLAGDAGDAGIDLAPTRAQGNISSSRHGRNSGSPRRGAGNHPRNPRNPRRTDGPANSSPRGCRPRPAMRRRFGDFHDPTQRPRWPQEPHRAPARTQATNRRSTMKTDAKTSPTTLKAPTGPAAAAEPRPPTAFIIDRHDLSRRGNAYVLGLGGIPTEECANLRDFFKVCSPDRTGCIVLEPAVSVGLMDFQRHGAVRRVARASGHVAGDHRELQRQRAPWGALRAVGRPRLHLQACGPGPAHHEGSGRHRGRREAAGRHSRASPHPAPARPVDAARGANAVARNGRTDQQGHRKAAAHLDQDRREPPLEGHGEDRGGERRRAGAARDGSPNKCRPLSCRAGAEGPPARPAARGDRGCGVTYEQYTALLARQGVDPDRLTDAEHEELRDEIEQLRRANRELADVARRRVDLLRRINELTEAARVPDPTAHTPEPPAPLATEER